MIFTFTFWRHYGTNSYIIALAVNGAKVYIVGRSEDKLENVVKTHGQNIEGQIIPITADITSKSEIAKLVKEIESREKCLCILINNAGIAGNTQQTEAKTAEEMKKNLFDDESSTFDDWCNTYRTNVPQLFFMTMAFLPLLQKASETQHGYSGTVINISSISGIVQSSQHHFGYNASKAAAIHLTKILAAEVANNGLKIRINSIAPGVFPSEKSYQEGEIREGSCETTGQRSRYGGGCSFRCRESVLEWPDCGGRWWLYFACWCLSGGMRGILSTELLCMEISYIWNRVLL
jgi:NAD(P)-dependent dehydrogenase (short-subunit alcohol dehydrogenase family)